MLASEANPKEHFAPWIPQASRRKPPISGSDDNAGSGPSRATLSPGQELAAYRLMLLIRRFEEKAGQLYGMGYIGGFCHLYIGQEAVVAGMQLAISEGDQVITAYRDHGHMLAAGMEPKRVMAELTGRRHGYAKGKGGSMHMFSPETEFLRRPRHRRRAGAARHRARLRQQISRQRSRLPDLFRRGRRQSGPSL